MCGPRDGMAIQIFLTCEFVEISRSDNALRSAVFANKYYHVILGHIFLSIAELERFPVSEIGLFRRIQFQLGVERVINQPSALNGSRAGY